MVGVLGGDPLESGQWGRVFRVYFKFDQFPISHDASLGALAWVIVPKLAPSSAGREQTGCVGGGDIARVWHTLDAASRLAAVRVSKKGPYKQPPNRASEHPGRVVGSLLPWWSEPRVRQVAFVSPVQ